MASNLEVDVAVLGGGITGLTTALLLKRDGARVAVLEADRVGHGVTGATTAKVSALQGTIYTTINRHHGADAAAVYADASRAAVERVGALVEEEKIECDLERRVACTFAATDDQIESLEQESEASQAAGLAAELGQESDLPFPVSGALRLPDQLQLHPVRYVQALAAAVDGGGSKVYEQSRALGVQRGAPCQVETPAGTISAAQVVVANHYPTLDRGLFFARLKPERSYCIAARVGGSLPGAMSISAGDPTRSIRSHRDLLILGGEGHASGSPDANPSRYRRLEDFAREHWPVEALTHRWSAQDPVSYDHLPVIGPYMPGSPRIYVASGFMKWGLSSGTAAAMLIADQIAGTKNPWAETFSPHRISLRSLPALLEINGRSGLEFFGARLKPAEAGASSEVPRGEARVVRDGLGKKGVFRDEDGSLHAVSLRCTHLGCLLRFNSAERSWDCPCHGSRFDVDGAVLEGPAVNPLDQRRY